MNYLPEEKQLHPLASRIFEEMVLSLEQRTHDSLQSKFFLPEELTHECRIMAFSFAMIHYNPLPSVESISKSRLYSQFFLTTVSGVQIFLKERSLKKGYGPYSIQIPTRMIKNAIWKSLMAGIIVPEPVNQVVEIITESLLTERYLKKLNLKNTTFNHDKLFVFMPLSILWGYLLAKETVST